jgi:RNA polymerase sigma factor (sigma-70 family)
MGAVMVSGGDLDEIVRKRWPSLVRLAYQLTHNRLDAEDLVQETSTRILSGPIRNGQSVTYLEAYFRKCMVRCYLDQVRTPSLVDPQGSDQIGDPASSLDLSSELVLRDQIWHELMLLTHRHRVVLVMTYYQGSSDGEIAEALGASRSTVRSLRSRAIAILRCSTLSERGLRSE